MMVEFANDEDAANLDDTATKNDQKGEYEHCDGQSPSAAPTKKNLKFKQLLARFQSTVSPRAAAEAAASRRDDPLAWLEAPQTVTGGKHGKREHYSQHASKRH
eukprot:Gregarina_sp_Poly_1__2863@NODE_17_length_22522_cov_92_073614_g15_i0_p27_GENE_NODE_17_length_22522_cov_92_073614_g15_i0NODE_17_length_22522_cov_92_073614_g15_i0_p27_ORF_typecomplete_len103_score21_93_NODE_17_length_22522_cov_92_073614_g15_i044174725